ncbi:ERF family protein [Salipiger bermudensis]|uniref:ERF family protein n=1 Tax=Salipiger bermudensis TaxID=344736 RepID=UPI001C99EBCD|nr:ERF family protein [Salipiger bermudensis]MBY6005406.1 ERF family protein [Salipiger bermudensis]
MMSKNVHQRLAAAMGEVSYIQKERKKGMQYTIVSHDAVTAKVRPVLLKHGIVYYPVSCEHQHNGNRAECAMTVRFVNIDEPSDFFDVPTFGYGIDPQDKGPGKAMSYAVKYALLKAMGLETGDDADHDSIDHDRKDPASDSVTPPAEVRDRIKAALQRAKDVKSLDGVWKHKATEEAFSVLPEPMKGELAKVYREQTARVCQAPENGAQYQ